MSEEAHRLKLIRFRGPTVEGREWQQWMQAAEQISQRFADDLNDDPFAYNETATVSVLASAAALAGMLAIAEFRTSKRDPADKRVRAGGRCDLWLSGPHCSWAFEFKQILLHDISDARMNKAWSEAVRAAECLHERDADRKVAGLVISTYSVAERRRSSLEDTVRRFAGTKDYAWEIEAHDQKAQGNTFLMFEPLGHP